VVKGRRGGASATSLVPTYAQPAIGLPHRPCVVALSIGAAVGEGAAVVGVYLSIYLTGVSSAFLVGTLYKAHYIRHTI
jgi:hypothetical protein